MPKHVWMMWLMAGGGTLVGATLTYWATRAELAPATSRIRSGWRKVREALPTILPRRKSQNHDFSSQMYSARQHNPVSHRAVMTPSGSAAFDEYRDTQLKTLEREAQDFRAFLQRLRDARDRDEFDAFLREKKSGAVPVTIDNG
jgi:hypothetical protein